MKALPTDELLAGARSALSVLRFVGKAQDTEFGRRSPWLEETERNLHFLITWALDELKIASAARELRPLVELLEAGKLEIPTKDTPGGLVSSPFASAAWALITETRRKLDRHEPKLRCAVNVIAVAKDRGYGRVSDSEFASLAVLRHPAPGGEPPTGDDARRRASWRNTRRRAEKLLLPIASVLRSEREQAHRSLQLKALEDMVKQYDAANAKARVEVMRERRVKGGTQPT